MRSSCPQAFWWSPARFRLISADGEEGGGYLDTELVLLGDRKELGLAPRLITLPLRLNPLTLPKEDPAAILVFLRKSCAKLVSSRRTLTSPCELRGRRWKAHRRALHHSSNGLLCSCRRMGVGDLWTGVKRSFRVASSSSLTSLTSWLRLKRAWECA
eukprot:763996-Hanusia_phi.AAC.4